jgi:thiol-disulfide isomerase/thioredoxin
VLLKEVYMTVIKHYTAEWCGPCKTLKPIINEIVSKHPGVQYQMIDVDSNRDAANSAGIRSVPVVIIEKNGIESNRFVGVQSAAIYENAIK